MIICQCTGASERAIRRAVHRGALTVADVTDACSAGAGCGSCRSAVARIIRAERKSVTVSASAGANASLLATS